MKTRQVLQVLRGAATYAVPGLHFPRKGTGGTDTARYCYSVWLRHLLLAADNGLNTDPRVVAELGPGDSIGMGLASLLSGAEQYTALDVVRYASLERNLAVFEELVGLFRRRENVPGDEEFPDLKPKLKSYAFPHQVIPEERLTASLEATRVDRIRQSILNSDAAASMIRYAAPWHDAGVVDAQSVDMVFSQAVMEHVSDPGFAYGTLYHWLKPGGFMSHQIDFKCHRTADEWNGHWTYSDFTWRLIQGKGRNWLNRQPHSAHLRLLRESSFQVVCDVPVRSPSELAAHDLAPRFRELSEDDLTTSGAFIQAVKAGSG